jgi:hypothetical protein
MARSTLQGLNKVILFPPSELEGGDADTLLSTSTPSFPELDLWTNLAFENTDSDEGAPDKRPSSAEDAVNDGDDGSRTHELLNDHLNENPSSFDLHGFLAGFGINPLLVPQLPQPQQSHSQPSLAQLLALHAASSPANTAGLSQPLGYTAPPAYDNTSVTDDALRPYPAKRPRLHTQLTPLATGALSQDDQTDVASSPISLTPVSAAEDKRRRNTAASARFRLKKKEREAALEKRAKELESRVAELERECEGLRRENGWLKGLVVGVTGANAGAQMKMDSKKNKDDTIDVKA